MSKTILVTGGLGTIGRSLVKELRQRNNNVWVIDLPHDHDDQYVRCDVRNYRQLEAVFKLRKFDYVYHLAAEFGRNNGETYYDTLIETNLVGTMNMIRLQEQEHFKMVFFSSSEVYGDYDGLMTEGIMDSMEIRQLNTYAMTKWAGENMVLNSQKVNGTQTVRVRPFNLYGPGEYYSPYRSVNCVFCYKLLNGIPVVVFRGHYRTSTYIDDAVYPLANITENFRPGEVYNIGGGNYHDIETLAEYALFHTGAKRNLVLYADAEPNTVKRKLIDNKKACDHLGFKVSVSLDEGVKRTVDWMRKVYGL